MRALFASLLIAPTFLSAAPLVAQSILPELVYGAYALDEGCGVGARRLLITPTDILLADPGLDIRIAYPDQRQISGDEVTLSGNFFVSVVYDGAMRRTPEGAVMSFHFPDLSFPLLEPLMKSVLGDTVPSAIRADLTFAEQGETVVMSLAADDPALGTRLTGAVGTWAFDAEKIVRTLGDTQSTYLRCFDGQAPGTHHAGLISGREGVYARDGACAPGQEVFVIAEDGWGLSIPFADPTIGFAFEGGGEELLGELYRAPFAPLAPTENSYIDIEVRDGAPSHRLSFAGEGFMWHKTLANGETEAVGSYAKCSDVGALRFAEIVAEIDTYL